MYYTFVVVGADNADASYEDAQPSGQEDLYDEPTSPVQDDQHYMEMTPPVKDQVYESMDEDVWKSKPLLLLLNGMTL